MVNDVEDDFIAGYTESVRKDRDILDRIDLTKPVQEQLESVLNSTKNTISFCFDRKIEIQILLSENGDILSPYDVRQSIMAFLHQSPVELMSSMVPNKEKKTEQ